MTILAWHRGGAAGGRAVVLVHDWGASALEMWDDTGWVAGLDAAGLGALALDLPGHADSADVLLPPDGDPAAWAAQAILADLARLRVAEFAVAAVAAGCLTAAHVAARAPRQVRRLVLVGCDDRAADPYADEVAAGLRDPAARVWHPEAAEAVARGRRDRRHHLPTLADWVQRARWPAPPRLSALRMPVLLAVGRDDPRHERAPRLAALFDDARLTTVPGDHQTATAAPELVALAVTFLQEEP